MDSWCEILVTITTWLNRYRNGLDHSGSGALLFKTASLDTVAKSILPYGAKDQHNTQHCVPEQESELSKLASL